MKKPLIGITLDNEAPGGYSKFPWYAIRKNYLHSVERYGGIPFPLYHSKKNVSEILKKIDGVIVTGGNFDIEPSFYGKKLKNSRIIKNKRTNFELEICRKALQLDMPLLGICGGEQLINVTFGGTLIQDINLSKKNSLEHEQINPRNQTSHYVNINKNTKLYNIIKKNKIAVNSAHHQAVDKIGKNLTVSSKATDGIIESIESKIHNWCIGVQWHPEFLITKSDKLIIADFVNESKKY